MLFRSAGAFGRGARQRLAVESVSGLGQGAYADAVRVRALAAYKDFLTLWKEADPDIPALTKASQSRVHKAAIKGWCRNALGLSIVSVARR